MNLAEFAIYRFHPTICNAPTSFMSEVLAMGEPAVRILVDADACPVRREVEQVARRFADIEVLYFANSAQMFEGDAGTRVVRVADRRDAADFAMVPQCRHGDIVVTDDMGLASMALGAGAEALSSRGRRFTTDQMYLLLERRHIARKARRAIAPRRAVKMSVKRRSWVGGFHGGSRSRFTRGGTIFLRLAPFNPGAPLRPGCIVVARVQAHKVRE